MGDTSNSDWTRMIAWQAAGSTTAAHFAQYQKLALQQYQELYEDAQQRAMAWTRRRQEALETGIDALKRMSECKTPVAMATICGEWVSGSLSRILADIGDVQAHALKIADHFNRASKAAIEQARPDQAVMPSMAPGEQPLAVAQSSVPSEAQPHLREAAD